MEEKQKSTTSQQPAVTSTATATATATATDKSTAKVTATANPTTTDAAANPTTEANLPVSASATTTTVPPSPQDQVIQLSKNTRPSPDNIVRIDPCCFHCDGRTELDATKCKNKSINDPVLTQVVRNV